MAAFTTGQVATGTSVEPIPGLPSGTYSLALTAGTTAATVSNNPNVTTTTGFTIPAGSTVVLTVSQYTPPTLYVVSTGTGTLSWITGA